MSLRNMKQDKNPLLNMAPKYWGLIYISLIPIFGVIYFLLPNNSISQVQSDCGFKSLFQCLYFSVTTITTLGYGDLSPITVSAKTLVMVETLLGMVVIGFFLNSVAFLKAKIDANTENDRIEAEHIHQEKIKLSRYYSILRREIIRYYDYTIIITHPREKRGAEKSYNPNFVFSDLADLYLGTFKLRDATYEPAINYYYRSQHDLAATLKSILLSIDLKYWQDLENNIVQILENIRILDFEKYILNQPNMRVGEVKATEFDAKMIREWDKEIEFQFASSANPYVALYKLIKTNMPLIDKVDKEIQRIIKE